MLKKTVTLLIVACMLLSLAACSGGGTPATTAPQSQQPATTAPSTGGTDTPTQAPDADAFAEPMTIEAFYRISKSRLPERPSLVDGWLKDNLNLTIEWVDVEDSVAKDNLTLMFAADEYPELLWDIVSRDYVNERAMEGFMIPINQYFDSMPNYVGMFTEEDFNTVLAMESASDGNMYFFSGPNYRTASMCWIYRESSFAEWNLEFPETIEELYEVLKTVKQNDASSIPLAVRGKAGGLLNGLRMAYFVSEDDNSYVHAVTGDFIPYGRVTDEYREALKWANTFYKEGLTDKEFVTIDDTLWTERYAQGLTYIEYSYVERVVWAEANMSPVVPDVNWEASYRNISQYPDWGYLRNKENPVGLNGYGFTDKMTDEMIARVIAWIEYISSEEGGIFMTMGEEGVTWEYNAEGIPQFMDHMYHYERNTSGKNEWMYGMYMGALQQPTPYLIETDKISNRVLSEAFDSDPNGKYSPKFPTNRLDETKMARYNSLKVALKDMSDEYINKFILGELDPNNDAEWQKYLSDMNGVGYEEFSALALENYNNTLN